MLIYFLFALLSVYVTAIGGLVVVALFANVMYDIRLLVALILSLVCIVVLLFRINRVQKYASSLFDELFDIKYGSNSKSGSAKSSKVSLKKK